MLQWIKLCIQRSLRLSSDPICILGPRIKVAKMKIAIEVMHMLSSGRPWLSDSPIHVLNFGLLLQVSLASSFIFETM